MSLGGSYSESESKQASGLRGTPGFDRFASDWARTAGDLNRQARDYAKSKFDEFGGQHINDMVKTVNGLPAEMSQYLQSTAQGFLDKASASGSMRGQNSPENTNQVVGSAMSNMGQFLAPYIIDFKKYITGLPEEFKKSRLGMYQNTLSAEAPGLGSEGSSSGYGIGVSGGFGTSGPSMSTRA